MKKSLWIRIFTALAGLLLVLLSLCALAETLFDVPFTALASRLFNAGTPVSVLITLLMALIVCLLGVCCVLSLFKPRKHVTRGYVMQKGENGSIGVSVKSIEGLVQSCVRQYREIHRAEISVAEKKDGVIVLLNIEETAGVNIPLSVGSLQKQIKQHVSTCTGLDVHEVRVMVESADLPLGDSAYAVQETAPAAPVMAPIQAEIAPEAVEEAPAADENAVPEELPVMEDVQEAAQEPEAPAPVAAAPVVMPAMPELLDDTDDRPLHQRLFGAEEQPVFVPAPPEMVMPAAEEYGEAEGEAEIPEEPAADDTQLEVDNDAAAETAEAVSDEDMNVAEADPADGEEIPVETELPEEAEEIPAEEAPDEEAAAADDAEEDEITL